MSSILAFSGSARKQSFNQKMVAIAAKGAEQAGASLTCINLADFSMPIFNEDLEAAEGMPEAAQKFKDLVVAHDGFLIASPEYNSAFSPLLKNALDWASRPAYKDDKRNVYRGKHACIMAASPGGLGGMRGLVFLRMLLANLGMMVLPEQFALGSAYKAFTEEGLLADSDQATKVANLGKRLAEELAKQ